jgi:putative membrane protein
MHVGHHYPFGQVLRWTRRDIARHALVAAVVLACYTWLGWCWLAVPWLPIALLGTAVAFVVSFKNNASYDRLWEARRIWGAIVNGSRTWGVMARDFVSDAHATAPVTPSELAEARRTLCHRHFAWLTALRYHLREPRPWESVAQPHNAEYKQRWFRVDEHERPLAQALAAYLAPDEHMRVMASANKATQILALQSDHLATLRRAGWIEDFRHMELQRVLGELFAQQGASERVKNFPYPRQYATLNLWFVHIFVVLIPLGMLQEFEKLGGGADLAPGALQHAGGVDLHHDGKDRREHREPVRGQRQRRAHHGDEPHHRDRPATDARRHGRATGHRCAEQYPPVATRRRGGDAAPSSAVAAPHLVRLLARRSAAFDSSSASGCRAPMVVSTGQRTGWAPRGV